MNIVKTNKESKFMKKNKVEVNQIELLSNCVRKIRLLSDIIEHKQIVESKKPEDVYDHDNFFKQGMKKIKNTINDSAYKNAAFQLDDKIFKYNTLETDTINVCVTEKYLAGLIKDFTDEAKKLAGEIFANDEFKLGKMEFAISVAFDDFAEFITKDSVYKIISAVLGEEEDFVKKVKEDLLEAYHKINVKPTQELNAKVVAGLITGVAVMGLTNVFIGAKTIAFGAIGLAESILTLTGLSVAGYEGLKHAYDKLEYKVERQLLRNEFYQLDLGQTTFSLAKSIIMIVELNKYRKDSSVAEDLYCSYIENYIDIKSDITLKLLMSENSKENYEKSKVYNNVDKFLVSKLKLA
jgi:hypothetical protein